MKTTILIAFAFALASVSAKAETYYADNHDRFFAMASVNGSEIQFQIDTGADTIALSLDDAKRAGLGTDNIELVRTSQSEVADGGHVVVVDVILKDFRLGELYVRNIAAIIVPGATNSLIGNNFLHRFDIRISDGTLTINNKTPPAIPLAPVPYPAIPRQGFDGVYVGVSRMPLGFRVNGCRFRNGVPVPLAVDGSVIRSTAWSGVIANGRTILQNGRGDRVDATIGGDGYIRGQFRGGDCTVDFLWQKAG